MITRVVHRAWQNRRVQEAVMFLYITNAASLIARLIALTHALPTNVTMALVHFSTVTFTFNMPNIAIAVSYAFVMSWADGRRHTSRR